VSIELRIERLVIDEAVLGDERASSVRVALERELAQTLAHRGAIRALSGMGAVVSLPACSMPAASHARARLGDRIAAAVGEGLGIGSAARRSDTTAGSGGRHG